MNIKRYINISKRLIHKVPNKAQKHFTFILKGKKIISVGWNNPKPNNRSFSHGYKFGDMHSELSAILKLQEKNCSKYSLINIRLNKFGDVRLSKPCSTCKKILKEFEIKKVYYSINNSTVAKKL